MCTRGSFSSYGTGYRAGNGPRSRSLGGILCRPSILEPFSIGGEDLRALRRQNPQAPFPFPPRGEASRPAAPPRQSSAKPAVREPACPAPAAREPVSRETPPRSPKNTAKNAALPVHNDDICSENARGPQVCHWNTVMEGQGRILDLTMLAQKCCPGKRVAVGISLSRLDPAATNIPLT